MTLATTDAGLELSETEELVVTHDRVTGIGAAVAIDDTTLGPGIGGVRWRDYPSEAVAITEVRRLARIMTLKSAVAGLPCGGAKSVIFRPHPATDATTRRRVMEVFASVVRRLDGRYVPGLDMGTALEDLRVMSEHAPGICIVEPSELTAVGLFSGIAAAVEMRFGADLGGRTVLVQGVGHVGSSLAARLAAAGAIVIVADVDTQRATVVARNGGFDVIDPAEVVGYPCDVFAPCAVGRLVDATTAEAFKCGVIAGAANDVLSHRGAAGILMERGVDYVPDFVINSGGVIAIHAGRVGWDAERTEEAVHAIGGRVTAVMQRSRETGRTPLELAEELASERLGHRVAVPE